MIKMRVILRPGRRPSVFQFENQVYTYPFMENCLTAMRNCTPSLRRDYIFMVTRNDIEMNMDMAHPWELGEQP